ncbi:MAG TPA: D-aminoacylase, partial [Bacteroidetes bacterium]|nr:D-aminoacylase [Bacteroidota bacterium]
MKTTRKVDRREFLKKTGLSLMSISAASGLSLQLIDCGSYNFDFIIENGLVFNGNGKPPVQADVGIKGELIAEIGDLANRSAKMRIPAKGMAVAPGFIDIHTHTETELLIDANAQSKIRQGVTTEMAGQCGSSVAPLTQKMRDEWHNRFQKKYSLSVDWTNFDGFYRRLMQNGVPLNWSTMVGLGTIRENVIGMDNRPASEEEIKKMRQLVDDSLNQGVWGVSTGLEYTPGGFASTDEIARICSIVGSNKKLSGIYATHMRNEDDTVEEAVTEAIAIAKKAGVPLQISHLKSIGKRNWGKVPALLKMIEQAREKGVPVTADRYPYSAYSTSLSALFPLWVREGGTEKFIANLQNSSLLDKICTDVQFKVDRLGSWRQVLISGVNSEKNRWMQGKRVSEIAAKLNSEPFEVMRRLLVEEKSRISMCGFGMSEENTKMILRHPLVAIGSDGNSLSTTGPLSAGHPHPRSFGTFPRVLGKYAREEKLFPLAEAVRKMTSLPAKKLGLLMRGELRRGFYADLVIFDPDKVAETATWE